jgi:adenylate cyclase
VGNMTLLRRLQSMANRTGRWPARRVTWALTIIFSIWVLADVFALGVSSGLSRSSYDAMTRARLWAAAPDPRIVIIDIDEASLARMSGEFGRWPWPRDTLATVLNHVERQQPAAIIWDIAFTDPDRLSPGGDAAFEQAVRRSSRSHFSVIRLPTANDAASQIDGKALPGLWAAPPATGAAQSSTVAMVPPALEAVAGSKLGYNNGYVDSDGVLRRYRYAERLADGSLLQSLPMSVLASLDANAFAQQVQQTLDSYSAPGELIAWRQRADAYPRIPFAEVFAQAEGGTTGPALPKLAGKVVLIGSTAPSLHDIHPTPLSPMQAGVESLATAVDNLLNGRHMTELPRWLQAALAIGLCIALALWVQLYSISSLAPALLVVPALLMGIGYLSLHGLPIFLDLHLPAGLSLILLAMLRAWNGFRRNHWCTLPQRSGPMALWSLKSHTLWNEANLDRLIDALERHAPDCRIVVVDCLATWPAQPRWPELAKHASVVGPRQTLEAVLPTLRTATQVLASGDKNLLDIPADCDRHIVAVLASRAWSLDNTLSPTSPATSSS